MSEKAGFGVIHSTSMERFQIGPALVSPFLFLNPDAVVTVSFPWWVQNPLRARGPWFPFCQEWAASLFAFSQPSWTGGGLAGDEKAG